MNLKRHFLRVLAVIFFLALIPVFFVVSNSTKEKNNDLNENPTIKGGYIAEGVEDQFIPGPQSTDGNHGFPETVEQIMERDKLLPALDNVIHENEEKELPYPDRKNLPQDPGAKDESSYPPLGDKIHNQNNTTDNPQTISTNFKAITVSESGFIPADNMGAVGPTQYV